MTPNDACTLTIDDEGIVCERSTGISERMEWADLQEVLIRTADAGLSFTDAFWVLSGTLAKLEFPHGSEGDEALLERLQQLPGFNNDVFNAAMNAISDGEFVCWRRAAQG